MTEKITVETIINEPVEKVWKCYNEPEHVTKWAFADDSWHAPSATADLKVGGKFNTRMEAKDGTAGFDFEGTYTEVVPNERIAYTMTGDDARKVVVTFEPLGNSTHVTVTFDMEHENPAEMQRAGWQGILENFKTHAENCK